MTTKRIDGCMRPHMERLLWCCCTVRLRKKIISHAVHEPPYYICLSDRRYLPPKPSQIERGQTGPSQPYHHPREIIIDLVRNLQEAMSVTGWSRPKIISTHGRGKQDDDQAQFWFHWQTQSQTQPWREWQLRIAILRNYHSRPLWPQDPASWKP